MKHPISTLTKARDMRARGLQWKEISAKLNIPVTNLKTAIRRLEQMEKAERDRANGIRIAPPKPPAPIYIDDDDLPTDPNQLILGDPSIQRSALGHKLRARKN